MMKLKITMAVLSVFSFAMLTACGEGFKPAKLVSQQSQEQISRTADQAPAAEAPVSVYQQAISSFAPQESSLSSSQNQSLANSIDAVGLMRSDTFAGNTTTTNFTMTVLLGCNSYDQIKMGGLVDMDSLKAGKTVTIGSGTYYDFLASCTDSECNELVVTVRQKIGSKVSGIVHYILQNERVANVSDFTTEYEYTVRKPTADLTNFYSNNTVASVREQCNTADAQNNGSIAGSTSGVDSNLFGGSNPTPSTSGDVFFENSNSGTLNSNLNPNVPYTYNFE